LLARLLLKHTVDLTVPVSIMTLAELGPNWAILKQPMNWALVVFVIVLLIFSTYLAQKAMNKGAK